jgi:hypothetical protein
MYKNLININILRLLIFYLSFRIDERAQLEHITLFTDRQ